jgi:hypothetical protein
VIVVLHPDSGQGIAEEIADCLRKAFHNNVEVALMRESSPSPWPCPDSWDDVLLVLFRGNNLSNSGNDYISEYRRLRQDRALLLPVALNPDQQRPPPAAEAIKSLPYDNVAKGTDGRLVRRIGAMLGLRVRRPDNKIFISYAAKDGCEVSKQLEKYLGSLGYRPWRDEAREVDDETKILPGSLVQKEIDAALADANLMLLVDTPEAPRSSWIRHEVDTANASLLPILPLCCRSKDDRQQGPRFRSLFDLRRWVSLPLPDAAQIDPLTLAQLEEIVSETDRYLCEIFQRRCRVPFIVEKAFVSREFAWRVLDQRLLMFESEKKHSVRLTMKVVTHCSIFDQVHGPALRTFVEFLTKAGAPNFSLYVYDGEMLSEPELNEILESQDDSVIVLHHQELATLIESNFTVLSA